MKAGRELDALVAEKVMGLSVHIERALLQLPGVITKVTYGNLGMQAPQVPCYSTDIAAAWEVLEFLGCNTKGLFYHDVYVQWQCVLDSQRRTFYDCRVKEMGDTAPHAICLAALRALGVNP